MLAQPQEQMQRSWLNFLATSPSIPPTCRLQHIHPSLDPIYPTFLTQPQQVTGLAQFSGGVARTLLSFLFCLLPAISIVYHQRIKELKLQTQNLKEMETLNIDNIIQQ